MKLPLDVFLYRLSTEIRYWKVAFIIVFCLWLLLKASPYGRDDTDPGTQWGDSRSGLSLLTDAGTGCQYLVAPGGGVIPRRAADGYTHMGCTKNLRNQLQWPN